MRADQIFALNKSKAGEAYQAPVVEARKVRAGERIMIHAGINFVAPAPEDGWLVGGGGAGKFMNPAEFARLFTPVDASPVRDLPPGATVEPVKKGERIMVQPWDDTDMGVSATADADGYIVRLPEKDNKPRFMSQASFHNTFRDAARPVPASETQGMFQYVPQPDDTPLRFIILAHDITVDFKAGACPLEAGMVLFENEDDEDGFTAMAADRFFANVKVTKAARGPRGPAPGAPG